MKFLLTILFVSATGALAAFTGTGSDLAMMDPTEAHLRHQLRVHLVNQRMNNLDNLTSYRLDGEFPGGFETGDDGNAVNVPHGDPHHEADHALVHAFVAPNGNLCAVAHLIATSGHRDLVDRVAAADNHVCVALTSNHEIGRWILTSGLTLEECVRIQEPSLDESRMVDIDNRGYIADHLDTVEMELTIDTTNSIDRSVDRLMAAIRAGEIEVEDILG